MKKHGYFVFAAVTAALSFVAQIPAHAQGLPMPGFKLGEGKEYSPEEKEKMEANERAARAAQSSIPTPKVSNDPWATVRADEPAPKPKKSKAAQ